MGTSCSPMIILAIVVVGLAVVHCRPYDPMVAFVCNKGAMHMDPNKGWSRDIRTNCMESKKNILSYCKSVYPLLDITNIMETSEHMVIKGWCPLGEDNCASPDTFKVQAYRCLVGAFQSDSLTVPKGCAFDHIHDSTQCHDYEYWGDIATRNCVTKHKLKKFSFSMLMPCGTDLFTGVEFVCCPKNVSETAFAETVQPNDPLDKPQISIQVRVSNKTVSKVDGKTNVVYRYKHLPSVNGEYNGEHDLYELAKKQLTNLGHDKVTKLMKEWAEARERVIKMRETDPKRAEKLNAEITERFQKEFFALESEEDSKALQLDAIHQQHVQANLNMKKRQEMRQLMEELQSEFYDVAEIVSSLQKYISAEQKDARHCMKHFIKIRARDAPAAKELLPTTIEHLTLISMRINQSIDLLDTLRDKSVVSNLKTSIRVWLSKTFNNLEKTIEQFKALTMALSPQTEEGGQASTGAAVTKKRNMYKIYADRLSKSDFVKKGKLDEENNDLPQAANMKKSEVNAEVQRFTKNAVNSNMSAGSAIAIAFGVVAAMMVVAFAILIVKKKSRFSKRRHFSNTYLQVSADNDLSPEDRHIAAMQNGYENPTYKLLEQKA